MSWLKKTIGNIPDVIMAGTQGRKTTFLSTFYLVSFKTHPSSFGLTSRSIPIVSSLPCIPNLTLLCSPVGAISTEHSLSELGFIRTNDHQVDSGFSTPITMCIPNRTLICSPLDAIQCFPEKVRSFLFTNIVFYRKNGHNEGSICVSLSCI